MPTSLYILAVLFSQGRKWEMGLSQTPGIKTQLSGFGGAILFEPPQSGVTEHHHLPGRSRVGWGASCWVSKSLVSSLVL